MFQILIVVGVNFSRQSVILSSQEKSILCPKSLHSNLYSADFIDEKILKSIKGMSLQPFLCTFVLMTNKNVYVKKFSTTDPPSKQDFKPSKQNHAQCSQPQKKRKDSLPPLACTQQAYGEKEHFAWTGNFLKMPHTSKKSYFIQ